VVLCSGCIWDDLSLSNHHHCHHACRCCSDLSDAGRRIVSFRKMHNFRCPNCYNPCLRRLLLPSLAELESHTCHTRNRYFFLQVNRSEIFPGVPDWPREPRQAPRPSPGGRDVPLPHGPLPHRKPVRSIPQLSILTASFTDPLHTSRGQASLSV
jgi:hypothetical protein